MQPLNIAAVFSFVGFLFLVCKYSESKGVFVSANYELFHAVINEIDGEFIAMAAV